MKLLRGYDDDKWQFTRERFLAENFLSPAKTGPKNGGFSRKLGTKRQILLSKPPKGTSLRGTASFDVFA